MDSFFFIKKGGIMQNNYTITNEMPKAVDRIYMGPFSTGRTRKIHCEHCGEDIDVDVQHVVYKIEILVKRVRGHASRLVITFCSHSHKQKYLKEHPEILDYIDFGISKKELSKHPEWQRYIEKPNKKEEW